MHAHHAHAHAPPARRGCPKHPPPRPAGLPRARDPGGPARGGGGLEGGARQDARDARGRGHAVVRRVVASRRRQRPPTAADDERRLLAAWRARAVPVRAEAGGLHFGPVRGATEAASAMHMQLGYLLLSWSNSYIFADSIQLLGPHLVIRRIHELRVL